MRMKTTTRHRRYWSLAALLVCMLAAAAHADELSDIRELAADRQFEPALTRLRVLIEAEPDNVEARLFEGVVLTRQGKTQPAIDAFDRLARDFPELPEPHNNLAVLHASQQRYDDARQSLLRALELQPRYDTAYENLGDVYAKLAAIAYERAHQLNRTNERAQLKANQLAETLALEDAAPERAGSRNNSAENPHQVPNSADHAPPAAETDTSISATADPTPATGPDSEQYCYTTAPSTDAARLDRAATWLTSNGAVSTSHTASDPKLIGYRVYLPALESKAAALVQIAQMKTEGVEDILRMADNGIALGVYGTEEAAGRRAARIREMGYKPQVEQRLDQTSEWRLQATATAPVDTAAFATEFAGWQLDTRACAPAG